MAVVSSFTTSTSAADAMDTLNKALSDILALQANAPKPITIALAGSSSPYRYVNDWGGTVNSNVTVSTDGTTFSTLTKGRFALDLGNAIYAATGRPVRFISGGVQGTTLATWAGDTYVDRQRLTAAMKAAGTVDFVLVQVGFNDVNQGTNTITYADQLARYRKLIGLLRSESGFTNLKAILNPSQDSPSYPAQMALQRMAEMTVVNNDANVLLGFNGFDLATFDNIHQTEASAITAAKRFYPQAMAALTGSAQQRGPSVLSTTPVSQTQTRITIKHGAGSDFTPTSGISGFSVFDSGGAALAISAATRESATTILLTHASTGGNAASVYYSPDTGSSDDTTQVHDNSALALPMEASAQTLAIAAFGGGVTPLSVSGTPGAATVGQSYSYAPTATGGSGTKAWAASGTALPAGLSISSTTGAVSGTPTTAGTVSGIIITVTDSSGSASQTISITVAAASAARTYGPTVTADSGWQDLGTTTHSYRAEAAASGDTGSIGTTGDTFLFCDTGTDTPAYGMKINQTGSGQYMNLYYRSGSDWVQFGGGDANVNWGRGILKEDVIEIYYTPTGTVAFILNGTVNKTMPASVLSGKFPNGLGKFAKYVRTGGTYTQKITLSGVPKS